MEEQKHIETIDTFLSNAIESGSNCILIGETHDRCPALLSVIHYLLTHQELCQTKKIALYYETYPALGGDNMLPYSINTISNLPEDEDVITLLKLLITKNIRLYGLETPDTNPFARFNNKDYIIHEGSIDELRAIFKTHNLDEAFNSQYGMTIQDFILKNDFKTGWQVAGGVYGASDQRIQIPNKIFCELINSNDLNTIRICIVGNAHLPQVEKNEDKTLVDEGMAIRLSQSNNIRNLVVTTTTNNDHHSGESYVLIEGVNTYGAIRQVCYIDSKKINADLQHFAPQHFPKNPRFFKNTTGQSSQPHHESDEALPLLQQSTYKSRCCRCCKLF